MKKILLTLTLILIASVSWAFENDETAIRIRCEAQVIDHVFGFHAHSKPITRSDFVKAISDGFSNISYSAQCEVSSRVSYKSKDVATWQTMNGGYTCHYECIDMTN